MTEKEILNFLPFTYCRLKISKIHGIGVHAIVNIKAGTNLFPDCSEDLNQMIEIKKSDVSHLNANIKKMMSDFFIDNETSYFTSRSLNKIDISYFLNHSLDPNCKWFEDDDSFRPIKDIDKDEELTINYDKYLDSDLVNK
tara:strand:- start:6303 stop:6722 length:420 start_codon:yes stop_codon:yes gene_type:complete